MNAMKQFLPASLGTLKRFAQDPALRAQARLRFRLGKAPRFIPGSARFLGMEARYPDAASFLSCFEEIFVRKIYEFPWAGGSPAILDVGANVGLSVLFFKQRFPSARITAIEADPGIFHYLEENCRRNSLRDVTLLNKAAWVSEGKLRFQPDHADGGTISEAPAAGGIEVDAMDLPSLLRRERFDFLKMDIEGAEAEVFPRCAPYLAGTSFVFLEHHSRSDQPQTLDVVLASLREAGFRYVLEALPLFSSPRPFVKRVEHYGFDLQTNIFAYRPGGNA